ncbi:fungal-specific transcription factor domain-containing protein [Aspergillus pseudoustus]|uniref:Fungal-specific transcription factor domain-containing protein n=1 Tax=Aspergillus pseudoustus TaxID=1810923 RepID=A0ABR4KAZ3_9EURO
MVLQVVGGGSCFGCRARKVRCDRALPQCSQCKLRSMECVIPEAPPRLLWLPTKIFGDPSLEHEENEAEMHVRRHPLYARNQQAQNAADLLALTSTWTLGTILEHLDILGDGLIEGANMSNGPFHVFRPDNTIAPSTPSPAPADVLDRELLRFLSDPNAHILNEEEPLTLPWPENTFAFDEPTVLFDGENQATSPIPQNQLPSSESSVNEPVLTLAPSILPPSDIQDFSMPTAKLLLDHYQSISNTLYTPAPVESKSPWQILYVPNLLSTLGEIALTGNSSDARVSLLFAVLAISAFRLDILQPHTNELVTSNWHSLGELYRERATRRLQMTLRGLSRTSPKKEKYKNILMPLLSMVTICAVSGEMKHAAHYLSDIDRVIRHYGVPKARKSRKVKMLHSIYLYLRILTEGAHIYDQGLAKDLDEAGRSDTNAFSQFTTWNILLEESSHTHNTLNLNFMQNLTPMKTTFERIYSLPESLFKLMFETAQLGREIDKLRHQRLAHVDHELVLEKAKNLENSICEWEYHYTESTQLPDPTGTPLPRKELFPYHLMQAMYTALIIYFYRSIRDMNAIALQPYVRQTIYHLLEYDKHKEKHQDRSSDICWPAFIAGCEATSTQSRQQITDWLKKSTLASGMLMFKVALEALQKVWAARSLPGNQNRFWSSILGESSDMRVLVLS